MSKTIILTGGGTAGHVTPNLALVPRLISEGFTIHYIGSKGGIEDELLKPFANDVTYHHISAGKLRRSLSPKNISDMFRVIAGIFQSKRLVRDIKPDVVFSKGGYVSVPVVIAAHRKAPVIIHESDYSPGLANKIASRYASRICVTFEDTLSSVDAKKAVHTGTPIRAELYTGDSARGLAFAGFDGVKPILLVMGGSLGAEAVNLALREALPVLLNTYDIIHLCGAGKLDPKYEQPGYHQFEYVSNEMKDVFAAADIIVSRAGANAVFEILALAKPALLIPLPTGRGDQLLNAGYFSRKGFAMVLDQSDMTAQSLADSINDLYDRRLSYISIMSSEETSDGTDEVLAVIRSAVEAK